MGAVSKFAKDLIPAFEDFSNVDRMEGFRVIERPLLFLYPAVAVEHVEPLSGKASRSFWRRTEGAIRAIPAVQFAECSVQGRGAQHDR